MSKLNESVGHDDVHTIASLRDELAAAREEIARLRKVCEDAREYAAHIRDYYDNSAAEELEMELSAALKPQPAVTQEFLEAADIEANTPITVGAWEPITITRIAHPETTYRALPPPKGWNARGIIAYTDGRQWVIPEQPGMDLPCEYPVDDPNAHSCDQMGCGMEHVLARFTLPKEGGGS